MGMRRYRVGALLVAWLATWGLSTGAQALDLGLDASIGYDTAQGGNNLELTGFDIMGGVLVNITRVAGGASLLAGGNLRWENLKGSKDGVSYKMNPMTLGLGGGFAFALGAKTRLETLLFYDFALSGDFEAGNTSGKMSGYRRINHDWRLYFDVYPRTDIGFGINWYTAAFDWKDTDDQRFQGFVLRAMLSHHI